MRLGGKGALKCENGKRENDEIWNAKGNDVAFSLCTVIFTFYIHHVFNW